MYGMYVYMYVQDQDHSVQDQDQRPIFLVSDHITGHGSPRQRLWPGRVGSLVSATDTVSHSVSVMFARAYGESLRLLEICEIAVVLH